MISRFVLMLELSARLQNTRQCICSDWNKALENQSTNLQANSGLEGIISKHFLVQKKALKFELLFHCLLQTVNGPCQLPSVNFDMSLRPIVTHT